MAQNTQALAERIGGQDSSTPAQWVVAFKATWKQYSANLLRFCGTQEKAKQLYAALTYAVQLNPKLMQCSPESLMVAAMQCAATGLYPGPYQEAALIPFKDKVTFIPMYQGLARLMLQSGFVTKIQSRVVWSGDTFKYVVGSGERIIHEPEWDEAKRGHRVGVYCIVKNRYGEEHINYLTAAQIERVKANSPGARSADSAWNSKSPDAVDEMWKKTSIRRSSKLSARTKELAEALANDADEPAPPKTPNLMDGEPPEMPIQSSPESKQTNVSAVPGASASDGASIPGDDSGELLGEVRLEERFGG